MSSISTHTAVQDPSERERGEETFGSNAMRNVEWANRLFSPATYEFKIFESCLSDCEVNMWVGHGECDDWWYGTNTQIIANLVQLSSNSPFAHFIERLPISTIAWKGKRAFGPLTTATGFVTSTFVWQKVLQAIRNIQTARVEGWSASSWF